MRASSPSSPCAVLRRTRVHPQTEVFVLYYKIGPCSRPVGIPALATIGILFRHTVRACAEYSVAIRNFCRRHHFVGFHVDHIHLARYQLDERFSPIGWIDEKHSTRVLPKAVASQVEIQQRILQLFVSFLSHSPESPVRTLTTFQNQPLKRFFSRNPAVETK